uniref:Uncharacterized protein n=1 Tax=Trichogramma kaykai TaxID=54128 RepID=A0ABD2W5K6_9HYME
MWLFGEDYESKTYAPGAMNFLTIQPVRSRYPFYDCINSRGLTNFERYYQGNTPRRTSLGSRSLSRAEQEDKSSPEYYCCPRVLSI